MNNFHYFEGNQSEMWPIYKFLQYGPIAQTYQRAYPYCSTILVIVLFWGFLPICSCNAQSLTDTAKAIDLNPEAAPESLHFTAHILEKYDDGSRAEFDTTTGYRKYYAKNDKLQMEGKVTRTSQKNYRDGVWNYYDELGLLMKQEAYTSEGKVRELDFMYFKNRKPLSETLQYFQGDYKDKASFKFIKIEVLFYTNGRKLSERHSVNGKFVYVTCWDSKGQEKPIEYLKTVKSVSVDE
jgi:hypothetical protein